MINNESFVLYESAYKQVRRISEKMGAEAGMKLLEDIANFGLYGIWPEDDSDSFLYGFEQIATSISNAKDRHAKAKVDGAKGGRPKVELDKEMVYLAYNELRNWEKVAARFNVSDRTLREKRKEWENSGKNQFSDEEARPEKTEISGKNLNVNVNVNANENVNAPLVPRSVGASPQTPSAPAEPSPLSAEDRRKLFKTRNFNM